MILYVFTIQKRHEPPHVYLPAFNAATKCQEHLSSIAMPGSLAERYGVVLQELRLEILRHHSGIQTSALGAGIDVQQGGDTAVDTYRAIQEPISQVSVTLGEHGMGLASGVSNVDQLSVATGVGLGMTDSDPGSSVTEMIGWEQFESLVSNYYTCRFTQIIWQGPLTQWLCKVSGGAGRFDSMFGENTTAWSANIGAHNIHVDPILQESLVYEAASAI